MATGEPFSGQIFKEISISGQARVQVGNVYNFGPPQPPAVAPAPPNPVFMKPFPRDTKFVGREDIFSRIKERVLQKERRIALTGIGGIGKSQIAIEYAYRIHQEDPELHIFWVYAANITKFEQAYADIADKLNIPGRDDPKVNQKKLVMDWLSEESHGNWLMILDNTDDRFLFYPKPNPPTSHDVDVQPCLADYLPPSSAEHGSLLITTRNQKLGMDLADGEEPIIVEPFELAEAELLLKSKLAKGFWDVEAASNLLNVLAYIPLAITQAAGFMKQNKLSIEKYLTALNESDVNMAEHLSSELLDPRREREIPSSIFLTWKLSFDQISKEEPRTAEMLSIMAFYDTQAIPEVLLRRGDHLDVKETIAIGTLQAFSLIKEKSTDTYSMHRLVQLSTQTWLSLQNNIVKWQEDALELLSNSLPDVGYETLKIIETLLPHAVAVLKCSLLAEPSQLRRATVLFKLAEFDLLQGRFPVARKRCQESYVERERILGPDHPDTLRSMNQIAEILWRQGLWREAEQIAGEVMEASKKVLGQKHPDTLASIYNLAVIYERLGKWNEAENLSIEVTNAISEVQGNEHPITLQSKCNLASLYSSQGRWKEAEEIEIQVLEARKRVLGQEHPNTLNSMNNLAMTYWGQGRWKEAENLNIQMIAARRKVQGQEHPDTLSGMSNLATIYASQGRWKEIEELEIQILEAKKRVLGQEHPDTLSGMSNLATSYRGQGRWKDAEKLEIQVAGASKRMRGQEHPDTLLSMNNLASTYWSQGRLKEAEELQVEVLKARKRILGREHPETLTSMHNLAHTWRGRGYDSKALALMEECVELCDRVIGVDHPNTRYAREHLETWRTEDLGVDSLHIS